MTMASSIVNNDPDIFFRGNGYVIKSIPYHKKNILPEGKFIEMTCGGHIL